MATPPGRTYRYLTEEPLYRFGWGLSYGTFQYTGMTVEGALPAPGPARPGATPFQVCATVMNAAEEGSVAADEVVTVYASFKGAAAAANGTDTTDDSRPATAGAAAFDRFAGKMSVPKVQLMAFARTGVLGAGESKRVCLAVRPADLQLVSEAGEFGVLPGRYVLSVGGVPPGAGGFAPTVQEPKFVFVTVGA